MILLACTALTLAALVYVFWLDPEPLPVKSAAERARDYLQDKRAVLYENLRDLHLEYRMGKLSDPDYQQMKARYQEELAAVLHQFDQAGGLPQAKAEPAEVPAGRCPRCGRDNPAANRFCGACGQQLKPTETVQ